MRTSIEELTMSSALSDPLIRTLMTADNVDPIKLESMLRGSRKRLCQLCYRRPKSTQPPIAPDFLGLPTTNARHHSCRAVFRGPRLACIIIPHKMVVGILELMTVSWWVRIHPKPRTADQPVRPVGGSQVGSGAPLECQRSPSATPVTVLSGAPLLAQSLKTLIKTSARTYCLGVSVTCFFARMPVPQALRHWISCPS
jgi:hypothetical protein